MSTMLNYEVGLTPPSSSGTTTASSVTIPCPSGVVSGYLLVLGVVIGPNGTDSGTAQTPSGWTALTSANAGMCIYYKTATSSEPQSYTVSIGTVGQTANVAAAAFVAVYPPSTIHSFVYRTSSADVVTWTPTFPSGVTSGEEVLLIAGMMSNPNENPHSGAGNLNLPASWTTEVPVFGPGSNAFSTSPNACAIGLCDYSGSTSNPTITTAIGGNFYAGFIVITTTTVNPTSSASNYALTVTGSGATAPGIVVSVSALSGTAPLEAIVASSATTNYYSMGGNAAPQRSITPTATGSIVYGAVMTWEPGASYTPLGNTTFLQNNYNTTTNEGYGLFYSSGTTSANIPVTLGASAPTNSRVNIALAEILASGTISVLSSAQMVSTTYSEFHTTQVAVTQTLGSQILIPGALLVAAVSTASSYTQNVQPLVALSDTSGLAWTELSASNTESGAYAGIWVAQVPTVNAGAFLSFLPLP